MRQPAPLPRDATRRAPGWVPAGATAASLGNPSGSCNGTGAHCHCALGTGAHCHCSAWGQLLPQHPQPCGCSPCIHWDGDSPCQGNRGSPWGPQSRGLSIRMPVHICCLHAHLRTRTHVPTAQGHFQTHCNISQVQLGIVTVSATRLRQAVSKNILPSPHPVAVGIPVLCCKWGTKEAKG